MNVGLQMYCFVCDRKPQQHSEHLGPQSVWRKHNLGPCLSAAAWKQLKAGVNTRYRDHECWKNDGRCVAAVFMSQ